MPRNTENDDDAPSCHTSQSATYPYCIQYRDGSYHDIGRFAITLVITSILSILGYYRASYLHNNNCNRGHNVFGETPITKSLRSVQSYHSTVTTMLESKTICDSNDTTMVGTHIDTKQRRRIRRKGYEPLEIDSYHHNSDFRNDSDSDDEWNRLPNIK
jgi:hypothetical protein